MSKEADVAAVLAAIDRDLPPLRGVLHAAMVLEDALLVNLDRDRMDRVLAPKLSGTWNLHAQTAGRPLDFFVMFSSLSSVFGHAGQGNYAAANAFLDAMAWYRRASGLPALTVNWGYLGEVGYLARRSELGERLERQGVLSFTVRQALALLEKAMQRQHVQVSVMRVEWSRWRGLGVTGRVSPRFAHLCGQADAGHGPSRERGLARARCDPGGRSGGPPGIGGDAAPRQGGARAGDVPGPARRRQAAVAARHRFAHGRRAAQLARGRAPGRLADRGADAQPQHVGSRRAPRRAARDGRQGPPSRSRPQRHGERAGERSQRPRPSDPGGAPTELLARIDDLSGDQVDALLAALLDEKGHGQWSVTP